MSSIRHTSAFLARAFRAFATRLRRRVTQPHWSDIEYFDDQWKERIRLMSKHIIPGKSVIDLGCGQMWLRDMIPNCQYHGVDYRARGEGTIICNFNNYEYPPLNCDYSFVSGCLEYIKDYEWFINRMTQQSSYVLISYCCLDEFPDLGTRHALAWVNHLTSKALVELFRDKGFVLAESQMTPSHNRIFLFAKHA